MEELEMNEDHPDFVSRVLKNLPSFADEARRQNFPHGRPVVYALDGWIVKEWPDGRIEQVKELKPWVPVDKQSYTL